MTDFRQDVGTLENMPVRRLFSYIAALVDLRKFREN
jgi:hypothetical protein